MDTTTSTSLISAHAAALFVSDLSASWPTTDTEVSAAIRRALRTHGGPHGCAADVAAAYGDYPELAADRMRWARAVVAQVYAAPATPGR